MFYRIIDKDLVDYADYKYNNDCLEVPDITMDEYNNDKLKLIVQDGILIPNPNYEQDKEEEYKQMVQNLTCTKRVMALVLQEYGVDYTTLKNLIATNPQAQLEWDLCERLERSNPLLNIFGEQLGITEDQIDNIFLYANGLIESEVLREDVGTSEEVVSG